MSTVVRRCCTFFTDSHLLGGPPANSAFAKTQTILRGGRRLSDVSRRGEVLARGPLWLPVFFVVAACGGEEPPPEGIDTDVAIGGGIDFDTEDGPGPGADDGPKLDVGDGNGMGNGGDCPGSDGDPGENEFSVIWIANSPEGTVSKIDTVTATELARYATGPDAPDPSRTTVNLQGDVAVANRSGSVTKIAAEEERCIDANANGAIDTSQGPNDVLPWGEDECVLWHHDIPFNNNDNQGGPRGTAWDAGADAAGCATANPHLWIGWRDQPDDVAIVRRLDGATGTLDGEVVIPDWVGNWGHGPYGGAADADGAYWGLGTLGTLIRIDPDTLDYERWENPEAHVMYGIAINADGDPWLAGWDGGLWHFDRDTEQFIDMGGSDGGPSRFRGLMIDASGEAWIAGNNPCGLVRFDTQGGNLVNGAIDLPGCDEPVGVSIDVDGMVWVVDRGASTAYKVDPGDLSTVTVGGLVSPYTYSDMTGAGLGLVTNPPIE